MRKLKIKFVDFWGGFQPTNNFFWNQLTNYFHLELSDNPEILFYSVFENENQSYSCYRIFYTGENIRPDFRLCDIALSFDYNTHPAHIRLPLYTRLFDLNQLKTENRKAKIYPQKSKFCCMVVSNPDCKFRNEFFEKLSEYKQVDSGGRYMNNIGYSVVNKVDFIKDYKFVISFENSEYPGYTTEKIVEPLLCGSIPIYWGNPLIHKEFNTKSFVNIYDFKNIDEVIEYIRKIDSSDDLFYKIQLESGLINNELKDEQDPVKVSEALYDAICKMISKPPVSKNIIFKKMIFIDNLKQNRSYRRLQKIKKYLKKYLIN